MAARQQQTTEAPKQADGPAVASAEVATQQAIASPKRDKFASMAARQANNSPINPAAAAAAAAAAATIPPPPKRDKFASMAARQGSEPPTAPAPKRDKFASMAQSAANNNSTAPPPKRDKFASLQKSTSPVPPAKPAPIKDDERIKELEKRAHQRHKVLRDLEKAEGHTWNLLQLASQTAKHLSEIKVDEDDTTLSDLSSKYRDTLKKIHSLLSPHAKFVKAYQNRQEESDVTNMYAARVETRLAQERRNVLEDLLLLEKDGYEPSAMNSNKRKHGDH